MNINYGHTYDWASPQETPATTTKTEHIFVSRSSNRGTSYVPFLAPSSVLVFLGCDCCCCWRNSFGMLGLILFSTSSRGSTHRHIHPDMEPPPNITHNQRNHHQTKYMFQRIFGKTPQEPLEFHSTYCCYYLSTETEQPSSSSSWAASSHLGAALLVVVDVLLMEPKLINWEFFDKVSRLVEIRILELATLWWYCLMDTDL